jgi:glycosyltransferase involved in cell wall biosynthesis
LASVTAQTLKPIETLIIDDGSTEPDTLKILDNLSDPGIKVIHQKNCGLAGARNTGIHHSRGDCVYSWMQMMLCFPIASKKLASLLRESSDAIAACCGVKLLGGERNGAEWTASYDPYLVLIENSWAAGLLLRKQFLEELSLSYDESMRHGYEDWEFNIRLAQTGRTIKIHPGALYHYRIHPDSMLVASRTNIK